MKTSLKDKVKRDLPTWEEESGLLQFLASVPGEVQRFNDTFEFDINTKVASPSEIDGDRDLPLKTAFIVTRDNALMPEITYCLYAVLLKRALHGYIGVCREGRIRTVRNLNTIEEFRCQEPRLHEWLRQLVRASCEKMMP